MDVALEWALWLAMSAAFASGLVLLVMTAVGKNRRWYSAARHRLALSERREARREEKRRASMVQSVGRGSPM